jgi:hypothetical protein
LEAAQMPHDWWMDEKMWFMYTMEFYSSIRKNENMLFAGKWMELENIMLSKVSQDQKCQRLYVFTHCKS